MIYLFILNINIEIYHEELFPISLFQNAIIPLNAITKNIFIEFLSCYLNLNLPCGIVLIFL